jgi:hypothetical protein
MKPIKQDRYPAGVISVARQTTFATGSGSRSFSALLVGMYPLVWRDPARFDTTAMIENWQQLPDGQIEFTMRRPPAAD